MNAIKKELETNEVETLNAEAAIEVKPEVIKKQNWFVRSFGHLFMKHPDLNYETWKSIEKKHHLLDHQEEESWIINHRWTL